MLSAIIANGLARLAPEGRLCVVAEVPNGDGLAGRIRTWAQASQINISGDIFLGTAIAAEDYWRSATKERSSLENRCFVKGLRDAGVKTMSEALVILQAAGAESACGELCIHGRRDHLWSDDSYLRSVVATTVR